jgi:crotonobetainyl-CoA:carnitine CoA-transferase CaiB-like acyl-CoA transferase
MERAGLSNELTLAINRLVIVRVSTYGQYGEQEYLGRACYDAVAQAFGGMMSVTGDLGPPHRAKVYAGDYLTGLTGWAATMMALLQVKKTGQGQVIDLAQYEAAAPTQRNCMPLYTGQGGLYGHPGLIWRGAPSIGEDTTDILVKMLNLSSAEIEHSYRGTVVHRTEPFTPVCG